MSRIPTSSTHGSNSIDSDNHDDLVELAAISSNGFVTTRASGGASEEMGCRHDEGQEHGHKKRTSSFAPTTDTTPNAIMDGREKSNDDDFAVGDEPPRHATGEVIDAKNTAGDRPRSRARKRRTVNDIRDDGDLGVNSTALGGHNSNASTKAQGTTLPSNRNSDSTKTPATASNRSLNPPHKFHTTAARLPPPIATTDEVLVDAVVWNGRLGVTLPTEERYDTSVNTVVAYAVTQPSRPNSLIPSDPTVRRPTDPTLTPPTETSTRSKPRINRVLCVLLIIAVALVVGVSVAFLCATGGCGSFESKGLAGTGAPLPTDPVPPVGIAQTVAPSTSPKTNTSSPVALPTIATDNGTTRDTSRPTPTSFAPTTLSPTPESSNELDSKNQIREQHVVEYINNISLSGRYIAGPSAFVPFVLEEALLWLILDDPMKLSPDTPANRFRLLQRYALRTLFVQENTADRWYSRNGWDGSVVDECEWFGISCTSMEWDTVVGVQRVVTAIDLYSNNLNGILPVELGLLSSLQGFNVSDNSLAGMIPLTLGLWTALKYFDVGTNAMTGNVPTELGQCTTLESFYLLYNNFTGPLPTEFRQWTVLKEFVVQYNALSGPFPTEFGQWLALKWLDVRWNKFKGPLPSEYSRWTTLTHFSASTNVLTGKLPTEYSQWAMQYFDVNGNALRGKLPTEYSQWTSLGYFNVNANVLTGKLPTEYGQWTTLLYFDVNANILTGSIPRIYGTTWTSLLYGGFHANNFTGTVPIDACNGNPANDSVALFTDCLSEVVCECCDVCY